MIENNGRQCVSYHKAFNTYITRKTTHDEPRATAKAKGI